METSFSDQRHAANIVYSAFSRYTEDEIIAVNALVPDQVRWFQELIRHGNVGCERTKYSITIEVTQDFRFGHHRMGSHVDLLMLDVANTANFRQEPVSIGCLRGLMSLQDGILHFFQHGETYHFPQRFDLGWTKSGGVRRRLKACWER